MRKSLIALGACAIALGVGAPSANALSNVTWTNVGSTPRADFYEHWGYVGGVAHMLGTTSCTASYGDLDNIISSAKMGAYNNQVSSSRDYNQCDTNLYDSGDRTGVHYGFFNANTGVEYTDISWNDIVSSLELT